MSDWDCQICGKTIRDRMRAPSFCPRCGLGDFTPVAEGERGAAPARTASLVSANFPSPATSPSVPLVAVQAQPLTPMAAVPEPRPRSRPAKRIRPNEPLEVRLPRTEPLQALNISATGLLVEHVKPFTPGSICDVEVWRSSLGIRLRAEVVRSVVSGGGKGSLTGLRYRTAVHFLET
ncbi:MAG: PilZ domain-containing protein, partial [candidate division NC10 bacterium]